MDNRLTVCCAHNLFAESEQIPHLQTEKCFCDVHAAVKNGSILLCRLRAANSARLLSQKGIALLGQQKIPGCQAAGDFCYAVLCAEGVQHFS